MGEGRRKVKECAFLNFSGSPGVKNPPFNAGDSGSTPGQGSKILQAVGQLSQHAAASKPLHPAACAPKLEKSMSYNEDPVQLNFFLKEYAFFFLFYINKRTITYRFTEH